MRWWIAAIICVFSVAWARGCTSSSAAYDRALAAETSNDLERAVEQYQYAARWYTPFSSTPHQAASALARIGREASEKGDRTLALKALRRLRGAILATRGVAAPLSAHLEATNSRLAELTADEQLAQKGLTIRGRTRQELIADHLALLQLDPTPSLGWSLLVIFAFLGWLSSAAIAIWRGLNAAAEPQPRALKRWVMTSAACFVLWLIGLYQA